MFLSNSKLYDESGQILLLDVYTEILFLFKFANLKY